MEATAGPGQITEDDHERIRAHYARAMPSLEQLFGGTPLIGVSFPNGWGGEPVYLHNVTTLPDAVTTVRARTSSGVHSFVRLNAQNVAWLCTALHTIELHGWAPEPNDPERVAFGRIVLSPHGSVCEDDVFAGARELGERFAAENLQTIPILDGFRGLTLWIPFDDGPSYDRLGAWLHAFVAKIAAENSQTFTTESLRAERGNRIYLGTKSNHPGNGTLLPYALRGTPSLEVALPVAMRDLGTIRNGQVADGGFAEYMRLYGNVFERERHRIGAQSFGNRAPANPPRTLAVAPADATPRNYIISAALAILADGNGHTADDILATGLARGLLPASTTRKYVYTALHEYVVRTLGAGKTPAFVQIEGSAAFRINEPADAWPAITLPPLPRWCSDQHIHELTSRLRATANGDPTEFEIAACDAFAALGFLATHVGGSGQPDGILVAPLGIAGYRAVLECKTASPGGVASNPRPEEPAKFRAATDATVAILLAPAFGNDTSLDDELRVHDVALWTVDDLAGALEAQIGPDELRPMLAPGRAESALRAILWERDHGRRKRIAVIANRLVRALWRTQNTLAKTVALTDMPAIVEDTLFVLVDEALAVDSLAVGAALDDVRAALDGALTAGTITVKDGSYFVRVPLGDISSGGSP